MKENITAIYCRLSKEDLDKDLGKTVSESIKNQRSMLEEYALDQNWHIYDFYIDEDYSGSDRDRPEFNRLITDALLGYFNIVLCKKQARFARDIEYVEKYIHGLFAERQIRFVAVLDNIDTGTVSRMSRKTSQINSLVDEWYLSDLSENIISSLTIKRKNAEFIGSWAPYGYRKDPNNKNALLVDPEAAQTVEEIFRLYLSGYGISRIAQTLNKRHILNPLTYKQHSGERINPNPDKSTLKRHLWTPSTISAILHNQTYAGYLVQGKYRKANYKSKKLLRVPKESWIIVPGSHEAIINKNVWESVQKKLNQKYRVTSSRQQHHVLAGKVYCGECGSKLVLSGGRKGYKKANYLCCSKHNLSKDACIGARIEESDLKELLLAKLNALAMEFYDESYLYSRIDFKPFLPETRAAALQLRLEELDGLLNTITKKINMLYGDKLEGIIDGEQYLNFKGKLEEQTKAVSDQQQEIRAQLLTESGLQFQMQQQYSGLEILKKYCSFDALTQEVSDHWIESVYIYKRKKGEPQQIIINWNF